MESRRDIPESPAIAAAKLKDGLADCGLFIASAPVRGFLAAARIVARISIPPIAEFRARFREDPRGAIAAIARDLLFDKIPTLAFYGDLLCKLFNLLQP